MFVCERWPAGGKLGNVSPAGFQQLEHCLWEELHACRWKPAMFCSWCGYKLRLTTTNHVSQSCLTSKILQEQVFSEGAYNWKLLEDQIRAATNDYLNDQLVG